MKEIDPRGGTRDCYRCNYDIHRCPGCGEPLRHGTEVCAACRGGESHE